MCNLKFCRLGPGSSCLWLLRYKYDTIRNRVPINLSTGISVYFSVCAFCIICTNDSGWRLLLPILQVMCLLWDQPSDIHCALCSSIAQSSQDTILWQPYTNLFVQDPCLMTCQLYNVYSTIVLYYYSIHIYICSISQFPDPRINYKAGLFVNSLQDFTSVHLKNNPCCF